MHAMDFYISACRCVMQADPDNPETWTDLYRLFPCLRQSLGCYVCFNILQDPMGPSHNVCKHTVCKNCVGGKMKLKPACSWCKDHFLFEPNVLQKILVLCFKKLCMYVLSSPLGSELEKCTKNGQSNNLYNILKESANFAESVTETVASVRDTQTKIVEIDLDISKLDSKEECIQLIDKPGCSSDDDHGRFISGSEDEESAKEEIEEEPVIKLRRIQRPVILGDNLNGDTDKDFMKTRDKRVPKTVVFFKRASENKKSKSRISQSIKKKALKQSKGKRRLVAVKSRSHFNSVNKQEEPPNDLEKAVTSELSLKKVKKELPPPELKPLTSCKCGKSGTSNQLTCLGQRCQCYSMKLPCIGCKCRGCRNPKKGPDSSAYPSSGIYGMSYLRSGSRMAPETVCVNM